MSDRFKALVRAAGPRVSDFLPLASGFMAGAECATGGHVARAEDQWSRASPETKAAIERMAAELVDGGRSRCIHVTSDAPTEGTSMGTIGIVDRGPYSNSATVDRDFLMRRDIEDDGKLLLIYLATHVMPRGRGDEMMCDVPDNKIAADIGWTLRKIQRVLLGLEEDCVIVRQRKQNNKGRLIFITWGEDDWARASGQLNSGH